MNQAILKILDDIAKESIESFWESIPSGSYPKWIKIAKDRISSLPSDTQWIDRLNNLKNRTDRDYEFAWESQRSYDKWQIDILEEILSNKN